MNTYRSVDSKRVTDPIFAFAAVFLQVLILKGLLGGELDARIAFYGGERRGKIP
jgi:hypothetical protein